MNSLGSRHIAGLLGDRRGVVAIIMALLGLPMVLAVGISVDYAQLAQCQTTLQDAVDNAALAGATVYNTSSQSPAAVTVATNYFTAIPLPPSLVVSAPTVSAASGSTNFGGTANNVTITASATIAPPFLSIVRSSFTLSATATASNPVVTVTINTGSFGSLAADWDSVWLYAVPMSNGKPVYSSIPARSSWYEIGSNCNSSSINYNFLSQCVGQSGSTISNSQVMPSLTATQPMAFVLQNVTWGLSPITTSVTNGYLSQSGHANLFYSALEEVSQPPSENTNYSYQTALNLIFGTKTTTTYPTTVTSLSNCSLIVQKFSGSLPTNPPSSGLCFPPTSTSSGSQYAAMSCAAMNGSTYMHWWNDMGGGLSIFGIPLDDKDYNDAHYSVTCSVSGGSGTGNTQVVLTR